MPGYSSYIDFYASVYHGTLLEHYPNPAGGSVFVAGQGAGNWSDASIPELAVGSILSGSGGYTADLGAGKFRSRIRPRETILVAPNAGSDIVRDAPHKVLVLTVPYTELLSLCQDDCKLPASGDFGELHSRPLRDPVLTLLPRQVWAALRAPGPGDALFHQGALLTVAGALLRLSAARTKPPRTGGLAPWQLKRVQSVVEDQLADDLSLVRLAGEVGLSPFHFARAFRRSTGMPPHQFLMQRRIARACLFLEVTRKSVTDIAVAVGFADASYFARIFRSQIGMSPRDHRQMNQSATARAARGAS